MIKKILLVAGFCAFAFPAAAATCYESPDINGGEQVSCDDGRMFVTQPGWTDENPQDTIIDLGNGVTLGSQPSFCETRQDGTFSCS